MTPTTRMAATTTASIAGSRWYQGFSCQQFPQRAPLNRIFCPQEAHLNTRTAMTSTFLFEPPHKGAIAYPFGGT